MKVIKPVRLSLLRAKKVFHRIVERDYITSEINLKKIEFSEKKGNVTPFCCTCWKRVC